MHNLAIAFSGGQFSVQRQFSKGHRKAIAFPL